MSRWLRNHGIFGARNVLLNHRRRTDEDPPETRFLRSEEQTQTREGEEQTWFIAIVCKMNDVQTSRMYVLEYA